MRTFKFLTILVLVAMVFSLAGCAKKEEKATAVPKVDVKPTDVPVVQKEIKIAIVAPMTGNVPTFGKSTKEGADLAIEEWNAKGGVAGMKIVTVVGDSQCDVDAATNAANKVIDQDGVHYIVGEVCSRASIAIGEIANAKHVVQISPTSTNSQVTVDPNGKVKPYTFRACFIDPFQGTVGGKFAYGNLGLKTAFVIYDQSNDYPRGLAEAFIAEFEKEGGKIVGKETYISTDTDFSAILAKVAEAKPELVYLPDYYNIVNLVKNQANEKGINAVFMGGDGWDSPDLNKAAAEGGYFTNHYSDQDTRPVVVDWLKKYGDKYKNDKGEPAVPDALATLAYDATNMLLAAIEKVGTDDPVLVKDALAALTWDGVSGKITFDANHNPIKSAVVLQVTKDGYKYIATVSP